MSIEFTALVTGATGGLGSAIATTLSAANIKVFLTGRNEQRLSQLSKMLGDRCIGFKSADLSDSSQINQIIESVKPTILINCAGIFPTGPIEKTSIKEFDDCFFINVRAPFLLARAAIPHMRQAGWGRIVNVGSSSAYAGFSSTAVYCASKHALLGLSRAMFHELKNEKIRVYCVSPGSIKTEMGRKVVGQDYDTFMDPEEVSSFILQIIEYDGNMISEEIRLNRMHTQ